jgi:hypothetical protein
MVYLQGSREVNRYHSLYHSGGLAECEEQMDIRELTLDLHPFFIRLRTLLHPLRIRSVGLSVVATDVMQTGVVTHHWLIAQCNDADCKGQTTASIRLPRLSRPEVGCGNKNQPLVGPIAMSALVSPLHSMTKLIGIQICGEKTPRRRNILDQSSHRIHPFLIQPFSFRHPCAPTSPMTGRRGAPNPWDRTTLP